MSLLLCVDGNKLHVHGPGGIIYIPIILQNLYLQDISFITLICIYYI